MDSITNSDVHASPVDYRDLVIAELADSEAALREQLTTLVDVLADVAFENVMLRCVFERERVERIHADGALARARRKLYEQRQRPQQVAA